MTYIQVCRKYAGDVAVKKLFNLLKATFKEWKEDKASRLAAALSYYTIFSLAPLLLVAITIVGFVMDPGDIEGELYAQIEDLIGMEGADMVRTMVDNAAASESKGLAAVVSIVTLLIGATGVFMALKDSLNTIWDVRPAPGRGIKGMLKDRALAFSLIPGIGFLLLVSLIADTVLSVISRYASDVFPSELWLIAVRILSLVISFGVVTLLFAVIYKVLPDAKIEWRDVWVGAAVTALLFTIGRFAIGLYIGNSGTASAYGAAGALIVILLWIYYAAQILFFGAEFTQVYARRFGTQIEPEAGAVRLTDEQRAAQGLAPRERRQPVEPPTPQERRDRRLGAPPIAQAQYVQRGKPLGYAVAGVVAFFLGAFLSKGE